MTAQAFLKRVLIVVAVILSLLALWLLRNTLLLAFLGIVIAVGISIPARWLQKLGIGRGWANALSTVAIGLAFLVLMLWLIPALVVGFGDLLAGLPQGVSRLAQTYNSVRADSEVLSRILPPVQAADSAGLSEAEIRGLLERALNTGLPILVTGGSVAFSLLANFVLVLFIALLFLSDPLAYVTASLYLVPARHHERVVNLWRELYHTLKTWLSSLFISITITVSLVWIVLGLLGMPHVLIVAVFSGFATFVPNIGAFLPLIPIAVFTLAAAPASLFVMAPAYLAIQLLESNVLTPMVVKRQLSIPAAGMLVFQLVAALAFGLLGVLLAVPLLAVVITLVRELYSYDALRLRKSSAEAVFSREGQLQLSGAQPAELPTKQTTEQTPSTSPENGSVAVKQTTVKQVAVKQNQKDK